MLKLRGQQNDNDVSSNDELPYRGKKRLREVQLEINLTH